MGGSRAVGGTGPLGPSGRVAPFRQPESRQHSNVSVHRQPSGRVADRQLRPGLSARVLSSRHIGGLDQLAGGVGSVGRGRQQARQSGREPVALLTANIAPLSGGPSGDAASTSAISKK